MAPQVVIVKDNPVQVREAANSDATVIVVLDVGTELSVLGPDATGTDGATRWVPVAANDRSGFVRSDLVTERRTYIPATATPVPTATPTSAPNFYADYPVIDAADWAKRPDYYTNKRFSVIGEAFNVRESKGVTTFQMWVDSPSTGKRVAVSVVFENTSSLQEGYRLRAYGTGKGTVSGTNGFGASITQPLMDAERIGPPTDATNSASATIYANNGKATIAAIGQDLSNIAATGTAIVVGATASQQRQNAQGTAGASTSAAFIATTQASATTAGGIRDVTSTALIKTISAPSTTIALTETARQKPKP